MNIYFDSGTFNGVAFAEICHNLVQRSTGEVEYTIKHCVDESVLVQFSGLQTENAKSFQKSVEKIGGKLLSDTTVMKFRIRNGRVLGGMGAVLRGLYVTLPYLTYKISFEVVNEKKSDDQIFVFSFIDSSGGAGKCYLLDEMKVRGAERIK